MKIKEEEVVEETVKIKEQLVGLRRFLEVEKAEVM